MPRVVRHGAHLGSSGQRNGETLSDLCAALVPDQNGYERPEVLHVERVRGGVSPLVMVAVVMIGGCHGSGVGDDGAVGSVGVWWGAGNVVEQPLGLRYMALHKRR